MSPNYVFNEGLKARIMRRVYTYWFVKRVMPVLVLQVATLGLLLLGIHEYVSVKFVLKNAISAISGAGLPSLIPFTESAFQHAGFVPQLLFGASALLAILIVRDAVKALRGFSRISYVRQYR